MFSFLSPAIGQPQFWAAARDGPSLANSEDRVEEASLGQKEEEENGEQQLGVAEAMASQFELGGEGEAEEEQFGGWPMDGGEEEGNGQEQLMNAGPIYARAAQNDAKMAAVLLCDVLGALCILLNAFVIVALIRNRRRVLVNVFYVLVLHCAIVDLIRGGCLIAWGMPHLLIHTMRSIQDRLLALKINQFTLVILRSCNLLTIFNLLVFTTNEFIVIKYPLHYRRYFRRRTVLFILALCWLVSLLFGIGSVFSNFFESAHSVMVLSNGTESIFREMELEGEGEVEGEGEEAAAERLLLQRFGPQGTGVTRRQMAGLSINVLSMLMIFVLCYVCLFTVLVCYGKILRTIRQFQKCGSSGPRRVLKESGEETTANSSGKRLARSGSIYHKRSVHQQRTQQQACQQGTPTPAARTSVVPRAAVIGVDQQQEQQQQRGCQAGDERVNSLKKVSMPGSPQSGASGSADQPLPGCGRCPNCQANAAGDETNRSRRCNSHRKWQSHLMSRHKYLIVIGTVLFVDVLFLFPYSGIQMVALLHLNNLLATSHMTTLIRWGLQILIGVHSVCQPLCYFRMTEFRRLACCLGGNSRRFVGSGSSAGSIFAPGRSAKSIGSVKTFGLTRDEDGSAVIGHKKSIVLSTLVSEGSPLKGTEAAEGGGGGDGGGRSRTHHRDRTNWVNPSVGERQMLLIAQRRKWTRNLSLLCKEEGEELEVFLSREYKRNVDQGGRAKGGHGQTMKMGSRKGGPQQLQKGGSLRDRSPCEEEELLGEEGKKAVGSEGTLRKEEEGETRGGGRRSLEKRGKEDGEGVAMDGEKQEEKPEEEGHAEEDLEGGACARLLEGTEEEEDGSGTAFGTDKSPGLLRSMLGRILALGRRARRKAAAGGEGGEEEEPTLLDSNWKRPGEVHQFRSYGPNAELRPKISDLSGLRSNSVFTPPNQSANPSRQPSTQWGGSGGSRKKNGKK